LDAIYNTENKEVVFCWTSWIFSVLKNFMSVEIRCWNWHFLMPVVRS